MLNRDGYRLLFSEVSPETRRFAMFLLAYFDLRRFQIVEGKWARFRTKTRLRKDMYVEQLANAGFLERGPTCESIHGCGKVYPVRIAPKYLLTPEDVAHGAWEAQARRDRAEVIKKTKMNFPRAR